MRSSCWRTSSGRSTRRGCRRCAAAIEGTSEVLLAVAATSLSLVVIFLPVAFMTGYAQRFIYPFGITMAFADHGVVPGERHADADARRANAAARPAGTAPATSASTAGSTASTRAACAGRWRTAASIVAIAVLVFASTFPIARMVGRSFLPNEDQGEFEITVDAPEGTSLAGMEKIVVGDGEAARDGAGRRPRHADHLRARQSLAPARPAAAARRAVASRRNRSRWRRGAAMTGVRRLPPDRGVQDADRRRREQRLADPGQSLRAGSAAR